MAEATGRRGRDGRPGAADSLPRPSSSGGNAEIQEALLAYGAYLASLRIRRHHGDHVFPRAAVRTLTEGAREGEMRAGAAADLLAGPVRREADAAWRAACLALRAAGVQAGDLPRPVDGTLLAWAALLLPVGTHLGPALVEALGGADLWAGSPPCHLAAVFLGRLDGVPAGVREVLLSLEEREDGSGPLGLAGPDIPPEVPLVAVAWGIVAASWAADMGVPAGGRATLGPFGVEEGFWRERCLRVDPSWQCRGRRAT